MTVQPPIIDRLRINIDQYRQEVDKCNAYNAAYHMSAIINLAVLLKCDKKPLTDKSTIKELDRLEKEFIGHTAKLKNCECHKK